MVVNGERLPILEVFPAMMTVPDCVVVNKNKIGKGNGEAKFYIASKDKMHEFYGSNGFKAKCFMLKKDLIDYLNAIRQEYNVPSQDYRGNNPVTGLHDLWNKRMDLVNAQSDVIEFTVIDQTQIAGERGYVNSPDPGYKILRELALPLVSYVYVQKVGNELDPRFYWKLFVDFNAIWEKKNGPLVLHYGQRLSKVVGTNDTAEDSIIEEQQQRNTSIRKGQAKYREKLLAQCPYCPFTMISDDRILVASHIKPWAASNDKEKIDPYNGYILSPLYDRLFDQGYITFEKNKHVILSDFISKSTWKKLGLENNRFIQTLPMDEKRIKYLEFHHSSVFKGSYEFE